MRFRHRQVSVPGQDFKVDAGVWDLIVTLNRVPGLWTLCSCQGYAPHGCAEAVYLYDGSDAGYVRVAGNVGPFLAFFTEQIVLAGKSWEADHQHLCNGCRSMSVSLKSTGTASVCGG
jgi:hypothetical protein